MKKFFWRTNLLVSILTLLSYLAPFINPATNWIFAFLGTGCFYLMLANGCFTFGWLMLKDRKALLSIVVLLVGCLYIQRFINYHPPTSLLQEDGLTVVSYNVEAIKQFRTPNKLFDLDTINQIFDQPNIDVVCFQEFAPWEKFANPYLELIQTFGKLTHKYNDNKHLTILTNRPILNSGLVNITEIVHGASFVDILEKGETIRIYNIHLKSNGINNFEGIQANDPFWKRWTKLVVLNINRYRQTTQMRSRQIDIITVHIQQCPYPVIVAGDLNSPPVSYVYRQLSKSLTDAFLNKGHGTGTTIKDFLPFFRIDYLFANSRFEVQEFQTLSLPYSDHQPVIGSFLLQ